MKLLTSLVLLVAGGVGAVTLTDDTLVGDLPAPIIDQLIALLMQTLTLTEQCGPPQAQEVYFRLYTRSNPNIPITIDSSNLAQIDATKNIVIVIHGWISSPTVFGMPALKDGFLQRYDCNLIMVDWSVAAAELYTSSYCQLPALGKIVGAFICDLREQLNVALSSVHVLGHSLGAQMAGFVGAYTNETCEPLGRITGLDAAGLLHQDVSEENRLDPSDATFVDVIETSEPVPGYLGNIGTVTFHVNCGVVQPGCPEIRIIDDSTILTLPLSTAFCSHLRAIYYYVESLFTDNFKAQSCALCPLLCIGDANPSYITMGENCPTNPSDASYRVWTNYTPPYALGCAPYPPGCS